MSVTTPLQRISILQQQVATFSEILDQVAQEVWEQHNLLCSAREYAAELEQQADPLNEGLPLVERLATKDHAV